MLPYARGEATLNSDIDFLVDRGSLSDLLALGGLASDLEDAFEKKVDVLTTQMLSQVFLNSIREEKILIYSNVEWDTIQFWHFVNES